MSGLCRRASLPAGALVLALLVGAAGCGSASGPRHDLAQAVQRVGHVRSGTFDMRLTIAPAGAPGQGAVGVLLSGLFALDPSRRLPIVNVTYTRLAGTRKTSATLVSDGQSARLVSGARTVALTGQQTQALAAVLQGPQGLGNLPLHLDRWIRSGHSSSGPVVDGQPTERIAGPVDLSGASADLQQLSGAGGGAGQSQIDLAGIERSSSLEALVGRRDGTLHRLSVNVGLRPPASARGAAPTAGVDIALQLRLTPHPR